MIVQCGDASGTGIFDIHNRNHSEDAIRQVLGEDRAGVFPAVIEPTACVGTVKKNVAELLGIPDSTIVAPGSGDNMMSALGTVKRPRIPHRQRFIVYHFHCMSPYVVQFNMFPRMNLIKRVPAGVHNQC